MQHINKMFYKKDEKWILSKLEELDKQPKCECNDCNKNK